jgi:hypothetical protein
VRTFCQLVPEHAADVEIPKRLAIGLSLCPAMRMDSKT